VFSIAYLFVLFAALLVDHGGGSFSPMHASGGVRSACCTVNFSEV
jgi:protoheme IX farnesyltransferase